ncbi:cytochrome P450 [Favolaschia claudopus]|uniref:Cytochrome P450 n=1 Tax=Favolaschia claudopus TaxID=2862362 RepID=A0AAW0CEN9_9AGAR
MIYLPSSAFRALSASKMLSRNIGWRLANTLAFRMLELAQRPELQARLREEIYTTLSTAGSSVQYDNMPLLNAFIKASLSLPFQNLQEIREFETLRMYPAAALSERVALEDSVIPLATPITTRSGKTIDAIPVGKGQVVMLGVAAYQRLDSRWGAKSEEFDPEMAICTIVCDLIGKFAFSTSENKDGPFRLWLATTLLPLNGKGEKGAKLCVKRVV